MKKIHLFFAALPLAFAVGCSVDIVPDEAPLSRESAVNMESSALKGKLEVRFSDEMVEAIESAEAPVETKSTAFNSVVGSIGIKSMHRVFPDAGEWEPRHRAAGLHKYYIVEFEDTVPVTKAVGDIRSIPGVEIVSPVLKQHQNAYFNDPYFSYQWSLKNPGGSLYFRSGADINVIPVWQKYTTGSKDVIVAVVDGGMQLDHPDLKASAIPYNGNKNAKTNAAILGTGSASFMDMDNDGLYDGVVVGDEHGCNVSSIIGATNNNKVGLCGIAGGSDGTGGVKLMSCEVFRGDEAGNSSDALVYAADHGAVIANNSWGYVFSTNADAKSAQEDFEKGQFAPSQKAAIDYFIANAGIDSKGNQVGPMKGGIVVFSSGNKHFSYSVPGGYSKVIGTAAMEADFTLAAYSNYGPWVDVVAPGGADAPLEDSSNMILGCGDENSYNCMSGTSQAAPHVSGVAALLVSYFGGTGFTNEMLKERLLGGLSYGKLKDADGKSLGTGILNAAGAFEYTPGESISVSTDYDGDYIFKSHVTVNISYSVSGNNNGKYKVGFSSDCPGANADCSSNSVEMTINCLAAQPGSYTATITVGAGTPKEAVFNYPFTILPNHAPVAKMAIPDKMLSASGGNAAFNLDDLFSDEDGETLVYKATSSNTSAVTASAASGKFSLTASGYGTATVSIVASDARNETATITFNVVARDTAKDKEGAFNVDIYPNPCTDILYVRPVAKSSGQVTLVGANGAQALDKPFVDADVFNPAQINVMDLPSGRYVLTVTSGEQEFKQTIVKL